MPLSIALPSQRGSVHSSRGRSSGRRSWKPSRPHIQDHRRATAAALQEPSDGCLAEGNECRVGRWQSCETGNERKERSVVAGGRCLGLLVESSVASERWTAVAPPRCRSVEREALNYGRFEGWGPAWLLEGVVAVGVGPRESVNLYFECNSHAKILKISGWQLGTGQKVKSWSWSGPQGRGFPWLSVLFP
jgi:hypothetical protein